MVSKIAMEDIERLQQEGHEVSPADVVRLNAFGLKIEKSSESAEQYVLPRVALLGDLVFHEPTIGDEIYRSEIGRIYDLNDDDTFLLITAFVISSNLKDRPESTDKDGINAAIDELSKKLSQFTISQVWNALIYVSMGNFIGSKEKPPAKRNIDDSADNDELTEDESISVHYGLAKNGVILGLGSMDDVKKFTTSELEVMMELKLSMEGGKQSKKNMHRKHLAEYYAVLNEIKNKGKIHE